ncbi:hypothetical protein [Cognatiyoonia sp. IB215182]|uniref:hypothetical protein n=1 Tax=Cognatiyoonia sp. IB215182 TaxID=3097353 RepID=UPI002A17F264|nr:hypothetical protein [Cognatiyoonia sp. IB215182]MDX8355535.1 hypothetical protein [Cognatiyoonia sp. IB215182]
MKQKRIFYAPLLIIAVIFFVLVSRGVAMGDPLTNLRWFFTDLFRAQLDNPEMILRGSDPELANTPPADLNERRALHLIESTSGREEPLSCDDVAVMGFREWHEGLQKSQEARQNSDSSHITPEMNWPTFWNWNSPAFVSLDIKRTLLGNLRSASVSVAVVGHSFQISSVIDQSKNKIANNALNRLFEVRGRGYRSLFEHQLSDKEFIITETENCTEFSIFRMEVI